MQDPVGLSEFEVLARRRHGEGRGTTAATGRGYLRILRTNLFSNILFVIGITLLLLGRPTDAQISVGVGLLSAVISSVQEVLGKRKLDRLRVIDGRRGGGGAPGPGRRWGRAAGAARGGGTR